MAAAETRLEITWHNMDKGLVPVENGKYGYAWVERSDPRFCETHTLVHDDYVQGQRSEKVPGRVYSERAEFEPTADNLLVRGESGDLLEALTRVPELRDKYVRQVKCIYIDPPFNTGGIFGESYEDNLEHSIWLTMMRDRLVNLKRLLAPGGTIWVHLDDHEVHRMRMLLDDIFQPGNFIAEIVWQKADSTRNDATGVSSAHDTILVYKGPGEWRSNRFNRTAADDARFTSPDGDPNPWWDDNPTGSAASKKRQHPGIYKIQHPITGEMKYPSSGRGWVFDQQTMLNALSEYAAYRLSDNVDVADRVDYSGLPEHKIREDVRDLVLAVPLADAQRTARQRYDALNWPVIVLRGEDGVGGGLGRKSYIPVSGKGVTTWWSNDAVGHNREAKSEIKALFRKGAKFATPKPERLLERIIHVATDPGDIVLDCFAGSGTTAAVAHKMSRRWVTCELSDANFTNFTLPRLTRVVTGNDPGGVTVTEGAGRVLREGVELPEDLDVDRAWKIQQALNKAGRTLTAEVSLPKALSKRVRANSKSDSPTLTESESREFLRLLRKFAGSDDATMDLLPDVRAALNPQIATSPTPDEVNWLGGGGFEVAHLSPSCFDYDPNNNRVSLTAAADDMSTLTAALAAHLGFNLTPDDPHFHARKGKVRLIVTRTPLTADYVTSLAGHVPDGESLTVASTCVFDGADQALRRAVPGSRTLHIPTDMFRVRKETVR